MQKQFVQHAANTRLKCANCQITIYWIPTIVEGKAYCCSGCADGGPCTCDYSHLPETGARQAIVLHHSQSITLCLSNKNFAL